jgi:AraC-like DNA-binding protein
MGLDLPVSRTWTNYLRPATGMRHVACQQIRGPWPIPPHRLRHAQVLAVRRGRLGLLVDGTPCEVPGGAIAVFPEGTALATGTGGGTASFCWIGVEPDGDLAAVVPAAGVRVCPEGVDAAFQAFHAARTGADPCLIRGQVLLCLGHARSVAPRAARPDPRIAALLDLLRRQPAHPADIGALVRRSGMGHTAFHAAFRLATGTTPLDWLRRERIRLATALLERDPAVPRATAAAALGFGSADALARAYRAVTGRPWPRPQRAAQPKARRATPPGAPGG